MSRFAPEVQATLQILQRYGFLSSSPEDEDKLAGDEEDTDRDVGVRRVLLTLLFSFCEAKNN